MDLTEAEDIQKWWQEYTEELFKIDLHDPDNHDDVITSVEPDILESEVKWALESITTNKASGGDGIPVELFQIMKDDVVKVLHSVCQQIWKTQQWPQSVKSQFSRIFKLPQNCTHFTCQKGNAQNPSSFVSTVCELRISRCTSWIQKMQRNLRSKCQHPDHIKRKKIPEKYLLLLY